MKAHIAILQSLLIASLGLAGATYVSANDQHKTSDPLTVLDPDTIEGKDVVDRTGHQLGDVDEVVHAKTGEQMAVIGLENSTKEVAVPLSRLEMSADGGELITMLNRADLEALPDYDPMDLDSVDE